MITWDEIFSIVQVRRSNDAPLIRQMLEMRDRYNLEFTVPMRTVEGEPEFAPLGPQIIHDGIEHTALRAGGPMPTISVPALDETIEHGKKSRDYARIRRRALYASWHYNVLNLLLYRVYRHFVGYGTASLMVVPKFETKRACIEVRNPLNSYPEPRNFDEMQQPRNCAFIYGKSSDYLRRTFGSQVDDLLGMNQQSDGMWDLVEWVDDDVIIMGVLGPRSQYGVDTPYPNSGGRGIELRRWPNRAGMCTAAVPRRITLDKMAGQLNAATGMVDWLERLMVLNTIAAEKNIFADAYALAENGQVAEIAGGEWKDGRTGEINVLQGVKQVGQLVSTVGPMTAQAIGSLERAARSSTGTIPQFGGENPQSLRTGRAIDTLGSYSVDPRIKEAQDVVAAMLERRVNPAILEIEKGYWPGKKYVCFSGWPSDAGTVEYVPGKHFETHDNIVAYAFPGLDLSQISVAVLQLNGGKLISRHTARIKHPLIDDADGEEQRSTEEAIKDVVIASFQKQVAEGTIPLPDVARVYELVIDGKQMHLAIMQAQKEAQERQVREAPEAGPGQVAAPEEAPGLGAPGQGMEQPGRVPPGQGGTPGIPPPRPDQHNLEQLLEAVRQK